MNRLYQRVRDELEKYQAANSWNKEGIT
jgi:hypothetical protein